MFSALIIDPCLEEVACIVVLSFLIADEDRGDLDTLYKKALLKADGHINQGKATTKLDFNAVAWLLLGQPPFARPSPPSDALLELSCTVACAVMLEFFECVILSLVWTEMGCQMYQNSHPVVALQKVLVANQGASADRRPGSAEREHQE